MSALVKLAPKYKWLNLPAEDKLLLIQTPDLMGAMIPAKEVEILGGEKSGEITDEVKQGQLVKIRPSARLNISRYTALLGYNPKLGELGQVNCTPFLPAGQEVFITVKAYKAFNIKDLEYVFTLYLLD